MKKTVKLTAEDRQLMRKNPQALLRRMGVQPLLPQRPGEATKATTYRP